MNQEENELIKIFDNNNKINFEASIYDDKHINENDNQKTKYQTNISKKNQELKKQYYNRKKIMKNLIKYIIKLLNDNLKIINKNIKFREIRIEKFSRKDIRKFMRKNIKLFCNLKITNRYKRYKENINQITLNEIKSKLGKDFLNIKISSIYKECFLANLETQTIPIKQLTKKEINIEELGNCLNIGNNPYNLYKFIKKLDNNDEKNKLIKIAKTLLSKKKKINKV